MIYSPNMLKTFDECQYKFFLKYIEKISLPQRSEIFEKGKKIHALANYYLKGFDISKMEKTLNADEKAFWESLKSNKYFKMTSVNTEYNLSCKVDKYWIGGRLDALMQVDAKGNGEMENGKWKMENFSTHYYILDYKTGNIPQNAENDFQTIVYLLCADKFLNKKGRYNSLKFVYLGLKNGIEKEIELIETLKKSYEEKISQICQKIDFAINSNVFLKCKDCSVRCEYCKICS